MGEDGCLDKQRCANRNEKRVSSWVSSVLKRSHRKNHSSQTNVINEQRLDTEYSRYLFPEHITANIMANRYEILRSCPILSNHRYPNTLVVIAPKHEYSSCAVRM